MPNEKDPHLTLTLSPPIGWERRGKSKLGRMVTRETGSLRQIQGFNARMIRENLFQPLLNEIRED